MKNAEDALYKEVAYMMRLCYPNAIYRFDFGAGAYLNGNYRLMNLQKDIQMREWKHPDFTLYEPAVIDGTFYCGMLLEMKAEGEEIFRKNGNYVSEHVEKQAEALRLLNERGYWTSFAIGIKQVQEYVDAYLSFTKHLKAREINFGKISHNFR